MNHMTITKIFTLEQDDIIDVDKSIDLISSSPSESAIKRLLRIGTSSHVHPSLTIGNLCNNAHVGEFNKLVGQATEVALIDILQKFQLEDIRQVPPLPISLGFCAPVANMF